MSFPWSALFEDVPFDRSRKGASQGALHVLMRKVERNGIPMDSSLHKRLNFHWDEIKSELISEVGIMSSRQKISWITSKEKGSIGLFSIPGIP